MAGASQLWSQAKICHWDHLEAQGSEIAKTRKDLQKNLECLPA